MGEGIHPVDVISMCSANGDILPLRLRMEDENHQLLRIDIQEVVSVFKCGVFDEVGGADEGATIRVELRLTNPEDAGDIRVLGVIEYTFK